MATVTKYNTPGGNVRYRVRYDTIENGSRVQHTESFKKHSDAMDRKCEIEYQLKTNTFTDSKGYTVGAWMDHWFDVYKESNRDIRENTKSGYRYLIRYIKEYIGDVQIDKLDKGTIIKFINQLQDADYTPYDRKANGKKKNLEVVKPGKRYSAKTVRSCFTLLSEAMSEAVDDGLIVRNPCAKVKPPKNEKKEYIIPTDEQCVKLMEELRETDCREVIMLCSALALRRGEALGLQWTDLDFKNRVIHIRHNFKIVHTKPGEPERLELSELKTDNSVRDLPMDEELESMFLDIRNRKIAASRMSQDHLIVSNFVFTTIDGKPFRPDTVTQAFRRAAHRAGLDGMRLHDLRHAGITYWIMNGVDYKTVSTMAGHSSAAFTIDRYAHPVEEAKRKAASMLSKRYFS